MKNQVTRFDTRLPKSQKEFFEYAARLGGYRSLTEFILSAAQKQADEVVAKHNKILATEKDKEIFFNALMNPPEPTEAAIAAVEFYNQQVELYNKKNNK